MSKYDDIVELPHFHASGRPYMSNNDRAAQFASYKALNGYEDSVVKKTVEVRLNDGTDIIDFSETQEIGEFDWVDDDFEE